MIPDTVGRDSTRGVCAVKLLVNPMRIITIDEKVITCHEILGFNYHIDLQKLLVWYKFNPQNIDDEMDCNAPEEMYLKDYKSIQIRYENGIVWDSKEPTSL
jgi:hypothetical protein